MPQIAATPFHRTWGALLLLLLAASPAFSDCNPPHPLCNSNSNPYNCRLTMPTPASDYRPGSYPGYRPKDFTIFRAGDYYHLFNILQYGLSDTSSTRLGHDRSLDLTTWEP